MDWERLLTHLGTLILGALVTLGGALLAAWRRHRESELSAGQSLRDELRKDLDKARVDLDKTREDLDAMRKELNEMRDERLKLKRALDMRDDKIKRLEGEVVMLQAGQRLLEERSEPEVI